jgi:methionyl-tRNA formyltransferase
MMKIAVLGCKGTTLDLINGLHAGRIVEVSLLISVAEDIAERNRIAGYAGGALRERCLELGIPVHLVESYALTTPADELFFRQSEIDLLVVIGWERLVPTPVLNSLRKFACGMHGSAFGLPRGRGRSPLNWALITGRSRFTTSLFRYSPGVDDGSIIGSRTFEINEFDTIATLHAKNRIVMQQLIQAYVPTIATGDVVLSPQPPGEPSYYPKRSPEDSGVDWSQSTTSIYNLVRAVGPPYPPAYCFFDDGRVFTILEAKPFDTDLFPSGHPRGRLRGRRVHRREDV